MPVGKVSENILCTWNWCNLVVETLSWSTGTVKSLNQANSTFNALWNEILENVERKVLKWVFRTSFISLSDAHWTSSNLFWWDFKQKTFPDISARICYREIWSSFSGEFVSKSSSTIVHRWANCDLDLKFGTEWDDSVENLWSLDNIQCKKKFLDRHDKMLWRK